MKKKSNQLVQPLPKGVGILLLKTNLQKSLRAYLVFCRNINDNFELFQLFDFVTKKFKESDLIKLDDGITLSFKNLKLKGQKEHKLNTD